MDLVSYPDPSYSAALGVLHHIPRAGDAIHPALRNRRGLDTRLTLSTNTVPYEIAASSNSESFGSIVKHKRF